MPNNPSKDNFSPREVAVIIENFQSQFRTFGEGMDAMRAKLNSTFDHVGRLTEDMFVVKTDIRIMKNDIAEIKVLLRDHDSRLTKLESA